MAPDTDAETVVDDLPSAEVDADLIDIGDGNDVAQKNTVWSLRFTTTLIFCNTSMCMGLLASDVRVSVPSHDSVNSFGSFSAVRAWMPKTSGTNANAVVLVMHLIALLAPHGA